MTPDELYQWRYRLGLTQAELAQRLGVHALTIYRWERGSNTIPPFLHLALAQLENLDRAAAQRDKTNEQP